MLAHERMLLIRCELDHSPLEIGMDSCENPAVGAEVRVPHVSTLDGVLHSQCDTSELVRTHVFL